MKTVLILLIAIALSLAGVAQEKSSKSLESMDVIPAQFTGTQYNVNTDQGADLLMHFLHTFFKADVGAMTTNFEGTEVVRFTVTETGQVKDIRFVNSICKEVDNAMYLALKSTSGQWKPAVKGDEFHECYKEVSLTFSQAEDIMATENNFTKRAEKYFAKGCDKMLFDHKLKKAERNFSMALNYRPYDEGTLYLRGICRYERGNKEGAMEDWDRFTSLAGFDPAPPQTALNVQDFEGAKAFADLYAKH